LEIPWKINKGRRARKEKGLCISPLPWGGLAETMAVCLRAGKGPGLL